MNQPRTHQRHKTPTTLERPRELVLVAPAMQSNINISRIVRLAGCCGVPRLIACGHPKVDPKIARDGVHAVELQLHRSLPPVLRKLKASGFTLVGLEQTNDSQSLHQFRFPRRTALILGHERRGIEPASLQLLDFVVEIPVYGMPFSYNVATAAAMALYEYCRQFPRG